MKKLFVLLLLLALCCLACAGAQAENRLTLMVYMTGADLESRGGAASADLDEMAAAVRAESGVTVTVLTGGASAWQNGIPADRNVLWQVTPEGLKQLESGSARSMGDPAVLSDFLRGSMERFPADRYALILWDHGAGPLTGVCFDERFGSDGLTLAELGEALENSPCARAPLSFVGFDACLMATAETAAAVAPYAEYMIASQEPEPVTGWDYRFLSDPGLAEGGAEAGKRIVSTFAESMADRLSSVSLSCLKLSETEALEKALDGLFGNLAGQVTADTYSALASGRVNTRELGASTPMAWDLVDLRDLAEELEVEAGADTAALRQALDRAVVCAYANEEYVNGLSIYAPFGNKEKYTQRWGLGYESLDFSPGYRQYVKAFAGKWLDSQRVFWRDADLMDAAVENQRERITMQLSPEEAADVASARLLILEKVGDGREYRLLNTVEGLRPENGALSAVYHQEALYLTNEDGSMTLGPLVWSPLEGTAAARGLAAVQGGIVTRFTLKQPREPAEAVYITWIPEEDGVYRMGPVYQYNEFLGIYTLSSRTPRPGDMMTTGGHARVLPEGNAFHADWEEGGTMILYQEEYTGEEEWKMRFLPLESQGDRYAVFEITDLQANPHLSEPVRLAENAWVSVLEDPEDRTGGSLEAAFLSADLFTGLNPYMELKFSVTNRRDEPLQVTVDSVVLNQTALPKAGLSWGENNFWKTRELQPGEMETVTCRLSQADLLNAGERQLRTFRVCVGAGRDSMGTGRIVKQWFDFSLQTDLGIILPSAPPAAEKPLAEVEQNGVAVSLERIAEEFTGDKAAYVRVRNDTDTDLWIRTIRYRINGSDWLGGSVNLLVPARCGTWTFSQLLTGFVFTGAGAGKAELPVSDVSEIRTLVISAELEPADPVLAEGTVSLSGGN